jgi:dTDP-4-amino-4,6-dideoxygalactose transaminase
MNEFEAAMGLCVLDEMEIVKTNRKKVNEVYLSELSAIGKMQKQNPYSTQNYSYFPIVLDSEKTLLRVQKALNENNIFPRRYFYPSLDTLSYIEPKQNCKVSRDISKRILCLPMYDSLTEDEQFLIIKTIKNEILKGK